MPEVKHIPYMVSTRVMVAGMSVARITHISGVGGIIVVHFPLFSMLFRAVLPIHSIFVYLAALLLAWFS